MAANRKSSRGAEGEGNVFIALGFCPDEAEALLARSRHIIAQKLAVRYDLASELSGWMAASDLSSAEAAETLGVSEACLSEAVSNPTTLSIDALVGMVAKTGKQVRVSVG